MYAVEIHGFHDCNWQPVVMVAAVVNRGYNSEVNSSLRSTILSAASPGLNHPTATNSGNIRMTVMCLLYLIVLLVLINALSLLLTCELFVRSELRACHRSGGTKGPW